jgi:hypothetical protein
MIPMSNLRAFEDMANAERELRDALANKSPGEAMQVVLTLYRVTPEERREALIAVMAARLAVQNRAHAYP